jgi:putative flippase GtrA
LPVVSSQSPRRLAGRLTSELARYFAASAAGLAVDFSLYVGLTELAGWHYLVSAAGGFCAGAVTVYALSVSWVFSERRLRDSSWEFVIFTAIGVAGLALTELVLYACTDLAGLDYRLSKLVAASLVFLFNFGLRKRVLFTGSPA